MGKIKTLKEFFDRCHWVYLFDACRILDTGYTQAKFVLYFHDGNCPAHYPSGAEFIQIAEFALWNGWLHVTDGCINDLCEELPENLSHYERIKILRHNSPDMKEAYNICFVIGSVYTHYRTFDRMEEVNKIANG